MTVMSKLGIRPLSPSEQGFWRTHDENVTVWFKSDDGSWPVTKDDIPAAEAIFKRNGLDARLLPYLPPTGGGGGASGTLVMVATAPVAAFFGAMAAEAGKDAWKRLKQVIDELKGLAKDGSKVNVHLSLPERLVFVPSDLPDAAYKELVAIVAAGETGPLHWDSESQAWEPGIPTAIWNKQPPSDAV
jgi:hypothetical protein